MSPIWTIEIGGIMRTMNHILSSKRYFRDRVKTHPTCWFDRLEKYFHVVLSLDSSNIKTTQMKSREEDPSDRWPLFLFLSMLQVMSFSEINKFNNEFFGANEIDPSIQDVVIGVVRQFLET